MPILVWNVSLVSLTFLKYEKAKNIQNRQIQRNRKQVRGWQGLGGGRNREWLLLDGWRFPFVAMNLLSTYIMMIHSIVHNIVRCTKCHQTVHFLMAAAADAKLLQSCPTLCDPTDGSPWGSPVPGFLQARTLEWVAISFSNAWQWKAKMKSLSRFRPSANPWNAAYQVPLSMGFSRQEYWSGVPIHVSQRVCNICFMHRAPWKSPLIISVVHLSH